MKTQEEIHNLVEAFRTVTKEMNHAISSEGKEDRMLIAMLLLPFLPTVDEFMRVLKEETAEAQREAAPKDPLDEILRQVKPNGSIC